MGRCHISTRLAASSWCSRFCCFSNYCSFYFDSDSCCIYGCNLGQHFSNVFRRNRYRVIWRVMAIINTHFATHITTLTTLAGNFLLRSIGVSINIRNNVFWCLNSWFRFRFYRTFCRFIFILSRALLCRCYRIRRFSWIATTWLASAFFCLVGILGVTWASSVITTIATVCVSCACVNSFNFSGFYWLSFFAWCQHSTDRAH